jgi:hypothetical protein
VYAPPSSAPAITMAARRRGSRWLDSSPVVVYPPAECPAAAIAAGSTCAGSLAITCVITYDASAGWLATSAMSNCGAPYRVCG